MPLKAWSAVALLVGIGFAVPAPAAPLGLTVRVDDSRSILDLSVEGMALPAGAVLTVRVTREFSVPGQEEPALLKEFLLPVRKAGYTEASCPMGDALTLPGRYRVQVAYDPVAQSPEVRKALEGPAPEPGEAVLGDWMASREYLERLLREQSVLGDALGSVGEFLDGMNEMEAQAAGDPKKGLLAWEAWRAQAVPALQQMIRRQQGMRDGLYAGTRDQFVERFLASGLILTEAQKFLALKQGRTASGAGVLRDRVTATRQDLAPHEALFRRETALYRLSVANALYRAVEDELKLQERRPDRERWARLRRSWEDLLALWRKELKKEVRCKGLEALADALEAWWTAEEACGFGGAAAARDAVKTSFREALAGLQEKASP